MGGQYGREHPRDSFCFYVNLSFSSGSVTYDFLTSGNLLSFLVRLFLFCFTHLLYQDNTYDLICILKGFNRNNAGNINKYLFPFHFTFFSPINLNLNYHDYL